MDLSINVSIFLFIVVFMGYTLQTISGFGAVLFALPLCMIFVERMEILPVFLSMSIFQSFALAYRDKEYLLKKEFSKMFTLATVGMIFGMFIENIIPITVLNIILGLFILSTSIFSLFFESIDKNCNTSIKSKSHHKLYPVLSGFLQSAYGVGGPMIVAYMNKLTDNKKTYRSMIALYFGFLNPFIIIGYMSRGEINIGHFHMFILLMPAVVLALIIGNILIEKISQAKFKIFVHSLLAIIGASLLIQ